MKSAQGMRRVHVRPDIRPEILLISNSGQAGSSQQQQKEGKEEEEGDEK
jgi:hypothetical protein